MHLHGVVLLNPGEPLTEAPLLAISPLAHRHEQMVGVLLRERAHTWRQGARAEAVESVEGLVAEDGAKGDGQLLEGNLDVPEALERRTDPDERDHPAEHAASLVDGSDRVVVHVLT